MAGVALATWLTAASTTLAAEGLRKSHVGGKIAKKEQKAATEKAEKKAKDVEAKNLAVRQAAAMKAKMTQKETVVKSPFAGKKKGSMRSQFTVGGGGSGSGTNY